MSTQRRRIAPRLANGGCRTPVFLNLPEPIKHGLKLIAHHERKSVSWAIEETIYRYFHLTRPAFVPPKKRRL